MPPEKWKFGPAEHGRRVSAEELEDGESDEGHVFEIIDGRFYVSPKLTLPEGFLDDWLYDKLRDFVRACPEVANKVTDGARTRFGHLSQLPVRYTDPRLELGGS